MRTDVVVVDDDQDHLELCLLALAGCCEGEAVRTFTRQRELSEFLAACKPASGPVQIVNLTKTDLLDSTGRVLEHHAEFSFIPNALVGVRVTEGPSGREG